MAAERSSSGHLSSRVCARPACGELFTPSSPRRLYCSDRCGTAERVRKHRQRDPEVDVAEEMRRWWLDRFTLDEILELAAGFNLDALPQHREQVAA